jgi:hypothetical protein
MLGVGNRPLRRRLVHRRFLRLRGYRHSSGSCKTASDSTISRLMRIRYASASEASQSRC